MINKTTELAKSKLALLNKGLTRYLISAMLAGAYVGIGVAFMSTVGGALKEAGSPFAKSMMGVAFSIALSLVLAAGADLFTGNNMVMAIGVYNKAIKLRDLVRIWCFSYLGNLIGSIIFAVLYVNTGLASGSTSSMILSLAEQKMSLAPMEIFLRAILCNVLVCLAVWCYIKLKDESAKLIMVFWCIFAFVTMGFEHSIANMTLFSAALLIPHGAAVTVGAAVYNILIATLGNIIGGAILVGGAYYYMYRE